MTVSAKLPLKQGPPVVTVIVPVYNLEGYVARCLGSLSAQSFTAFEVFLIDDGSTDRTATVCHAHAARDPRFRVITKPNEGQGVARNLGLELAQGRYVAFVDGDDWLHPRALGVAVQALEADGGDFLNFGLHFVDERGRVKARFDRWRVRCLEGEAIVRHAMLDDQILTSPCNKLYRRELLERHHIRFPDTRGCEDVYFSRVLSLHARRCIFIDDVLYLALVRQGSTTRGARPRLLEEARAVVMAERQTLETLGRFEGLRTLFSAHVLKLFTHLLVLAGARCATRDEFDACVAAARAVGFFGFAVDEQARRLLPTPNRLALWFCVRPGLLWSLVGAARRLGWRPAY